MNPASVHLALNIFPPALNIAGLVVLALALAWKNQPVLRAALVVLLLSSLISIPVFLTGEPAEELVEELEGVNKMAIHPHEEAAESAFIVLCVQGAAALAMLIWFARRDAKKWALVVFVLLTLMATTAVFRVAYLGGKVRHPETEMAR